MGKILSNVIRFKSPETPTNEVKTAPQSTSTASIEISQASHEPPVVSPKCARSDSLFSPTSVSGITLINKTAITGLKKLTIPHILRSVLVKTPCSCSSTKLAELSKPDIPNMAAEKPRKRAVLMLPEAIGACQLI
ncbi:hypothetical protein D3C72_1490710 [compost metagenome]